MITNQDFLKLEKAESQVAEEKGIEIYKFPTNAAMFEAMGINAAL